MPSRFILRNRSRRLFVGHQELAPEPQEPGHITRIPIQRAPSLTSTRSLGHEARSVPRSCGTTAFSARRRKAQQACHGQVVGARVVKLASPDTGLRKQEKGGRKPSKKYEHLHHPASPPRLEHAQTVTESLGLREHQGRASREQASVASTTRRIHIHVPTAIRRRHVRRRGGFFLRGDQEDGMKFTRFTQPLCRTECLLSSQKRHPLPLTTRLPDTPAPEKKRRGRAHQHILRIPSSSLASLALEPANLSVVSRRKIVMLPFAQPFSSRVPHLVAAAAGSGPGGSRRAPRVVASLEGGWGGGRQASVSSCAPVIPARR